MSKLYVLDANVCWLNIYQPVWLVSFSFALVSACVSMLAAVHATATWNLRGCSVYVPPDWQDPFTHRLCKNRDESTRLLLVVFKVAVVSLQAEVH